jgi:LCP family protein required for cell wall assembly
MNLSKKKFWIIGLSVIIIAWLGAGFYFRLPAGEIAVDNPNGLVQFDKFDVLLLGIDGRKETDYSDRADTIILASFDGKDKKAKLLTIPRDTRIKYHDKWQKINAVYGIDGGPGTCRAVEEILGTKIDRYAVVDFNGVVELVDLMGGVEVDVPKRMYKPLENIDLKKGLQHLDGEQTLGYMRYRDATLSDFDRSERQKEIILQLSEKLLNPKNLVKLPEMVDMALKYMNTDLNNQEIISFAKIGTEVFNNGIESTILPGKGEFINGGWYYIADVSLLTEEVK